MRKLNAAQPIVFPNGTMQPLFRDFLLSLENGLSVSWDQVDDKPSTLAGYGITDALALTGGNLTGDFSVGSTVFFVDESSERVGIGTATPARALEISSSVPAIRLTDTDVSGLYGEFLPLAGGTWRLRADQGNVQAGSAIAFDVDGAEIMLMDGGGDVRPGADGTQNLGTASFRWSTVYATTGTINTSDRRLKRDAIPLPLAASYAFVGAITPGRYRWKDVVNEFRVVDDDGNETGEVRTETTTDDQYYFGYFAQDAAQALIDLGEDPRQYGMFHYCPESDRYGMRYTEMIAPIHAVVNDHTARIDALENALAAAMSRIAALEALP